MRKKIYILYNKQTDIRYCILCKCSFLFYFTCFYHLH